MDVNNGDLEGDVEGLRSDVLCTRENSMAIIGGTNDSETLFGTDEDDQITGLGGNDLLIGFSGNDLVEMAETGMMSLTAVTALIS